MDNLLCSIHYAHGNLELAQGQTAKAREIYEKGFQMSFKLKDTHILTATFHYKLGVVDTILGDFTSGM